MKKINYQLNLLVVEAHGLMLAQLKISMKLPLLYLL